MINIVRNYPAGFYKSIAAAQCILDDRHRRKIATKALRKYNKSSDCDIAHEAPF
jgi:hypothetical protein